MANNKNIAKLQKGNVRIENLVKKFGDTVAVNDVSLDIEHGEFLTLLGPSGSGKTTILMMIAGFQIPSSGKIFIENDMVISKPSYKRNIGMVFQNYALFPHMTVYENIAFPLRMRKLKNEEISKSVENILNIIKLAGLSSRYPRQLSGGQQQRVALARALVYNPPVLLMDEPLGALDKKLREHMQLEVKHIQKSLGLTVIYVTHDQAEALTMSDRIAVLNQGRIEQVGSSGDLYEKPRNRFVADFIGETNVIDTELAGEKDGRLELVTSNGLKILASNRLSLLDRKVTVAIRPERINFVKSRHEVLNTYGGVIEEVIYLGDTIKYKVWIENQVSLYVTEPNDLGSRRYKEGEPVLIGWKDEDMNLL